MSRRRNRNEVVPYYPPQQLPQIPPQMLQQLLQQQLMQQTQYPPPQVYQPPYRPRPPVRKKKRESGGQIVKNGFILFLLSWIPCGMGWPGITFIIWIVIAAYWMEAIMGRKRR